MENYYGDSEDSSDHSATTITTVLLNCAAILCVVGLLKNTLCPCFGFGTIQTVKNIDWYATKDTEWRYRVE